MAEPPAPSTLKPFERAALALSRFVNERPLPKRAQTEFNRYITLPWVRRGLGLRVYAENIEWLLDMEPDRGVMFAANHRSFFDQWVNMLTLFGARASWPERMYFPVRSNFFYERFGGLMVNFATGMGVMYPPIFRDRSRTELNKDAVTRVIGYLREPGSVVGVHPEGTRNSGDDPYKLLPAQPGIGEIALKSRAILIPVFVNGMGNSAAKEIFDGQKIASRRDKPIIIIYGQPIDLSHYDGQLPRAALYKKVSDEIVKAISVLIPREQEIRKACLDGDILDSDPHWLSNLCATRR